MDRYVGKRLDGRYEIREIIGVGGMAVVYKAFDTIEKRVVAIKILKEEFVTNEEFVRRFKNESKAIAVLSHPNIVKIFDVSFGDLIQYIVMEYIEGITLKQYIEEHRDISWKETVATVMQILRALQHAHDKGIIHRDVKPQNIMLTDDGTIKVADFGIARFSRSEHRTITDKAIGSVHYISPEQARGDITDEKADIYSVGVIMYEMLTGTLPFEAESAVIVAMMQLQNEAKPMREINPTIPLGLSQITMNAMQKDIARRYQTAAEMLCDLETFRRDPSATFEHSYFVDNAPTRFVESAADEVSGRNEPSSKKKASWVPILTGVMVGVAVIVAIILALSLFGKLNTSSKAMKCPNFVGMTVDEINEKYNTEDYTFDVVYEETSDYAVGEVIKQNRAEGTEIKKKDKIRLTIAKSAELAIVPDVSNDTESLARKTLKEAGFTDISVEQVYDDVVKEGNVVKTEPLNGSQIAPDKPITIYISKGKEIHYTTVPNILGYEQDSAENMLKKQKLTVGNITEQQSSQSKGYVISQSISGDTQVEEGTTVNFVVSTGENTKAYNMDIIIDLPNDCSLESGYILAEADSGSNYQSALLNFSTDGSCTITVKSTQQRDTLTVKILDGDERFEYKYQKIAINFSENTYEVSKLYDDYPKVEETE